MRGDLPPVNPQPSAPQQSPPRARGSTYRSGSFHADCSVSPACAGIYLVQGPQGEKGESLPRVRGDLPRGIALLSIGRASPPRARGSTRSGPVGVDPVMVSPACAGIYRARRPVRPAHAGLPRVRGDLPAARIA